MTAPLTPRASLPRFRDRLKLGPDLLVSPFCLGVCSPDVVESAFDRGINFFFLSTDLHWELYEGLRSGLTRLLRKRPESRQDIVVAATSYIDGPMCLVGAGDLLELIPELERIDLFVAGGVYSYNTPARFERLRETMAIHDLRTPVGASFHDRQAALDCLQGDLLDIAFLRYNPLHPGAETDVFPQLAPGQRALLYNFKSLHRYVNPDKMLALGIPPHLWRPQRSDMYRFALSPPVMDGTLFACNHLDHLDALEQALERGPLQDKQATYLKNIALLSSGEAEMST